MLGFTANAEIKRAISSPVSDSARRRQLTVEHQAMTGLWGYSLRIRSPPDAVTIHIKNPFAVQLHLQGSHLS
jgi:hypothetical protein